MCEYWIGSRFWVALEISFNNIFVSPKLLSLPLIFTFYPKMERWMSTMVTPLSLTATLLFSHMTGTYYTAPQRFHSSAWLWLPLLWGWTPLSTYPTTFSLRIILSPSLSLSCVFLSPVSHSSKLSNLRRRGHRKSQFRVSQSGKWKSQDLRQASYGRGCRSLVGLSPQPVGTVLTLGS